MDLTLRICLVDDAVDFQLLVAKVVNQLWPQWSFYGFESGQALLDNLPSLTPRPKLILLDQHMPGLDGQHTLRALRQQPGYGSIPVVLMSADASPSEIRHGFEAGASAFLAKSLEYGSLTTMLTEAMQYAK